jgi:hypothetical protein
MTFRFFQDQPLHVKIWRFRHYLRIPFDACVFWVRSVEEETATPPTEEYERMSFSQCWGLAIGMAQCRMWWLYPVEDITSDPNFPLFPEEFFGPLLTEENDPATIEGMNTMSDFQTEIQIDEFFTPSPEDYEDPAEHKEGAD